jgi:hypothetical protein
MVILKRAGDIPVQDRHIKALLYGQPGAGKTWGASQAPSPAILLTERNGLETVIESNPDAMIYQAETMKDVRDFWRDAQSGQLAKAGIRSVVVDSLTEIQRLMKIEIEESNGTEDFSIKDWGTLTEGMRRFVRGMRDLNYHVVCTALAQHDIEEATGIRWICPSFQGRKLPHEIAQYFNVVAYVYTQKEKEGDGVKHLATFTGGARYVTKRCGVLTGVVSTDVGKWIEHLTKK